MFSKKKFILVGPAIVVVIIVVALTKSQFLSIFQPKSSQQTVKNQVPSERLQPTIESSPSSDLQAAPTQITASPLEKSVNLNQPFEMKVGSRVEVGQTGLKLKTTGITPPPADTDFPTAIEIQSSFAGKTEDLVFLVGGTFAPEPEETRRQRDSFGFNVYINKVVSGTVTLTVVKK